MTTAREQDAGEKAVESRHSPMGGPSPTGDPGMMVFWGSIGAVVGAFLGYLFRPSVPLLGQLPFTAVISRGGSLGQLDRLLLTSVAQQSFNYVIVGALIGAAIGAFIGYRQKQDTGADSDGHTRYRPSVDSGSTAAQPPPPQTSVAASTGVPVTIQLGQTREAVMAALGTPQKVMDLGPKTIFIYPDLKITFAEGKVVDVL